MAKAKKMDTFAGEVHKRLDDIFNEEVEPSAENMNPSPLPEIEDLILAIDVEINDANIDALSNQFTRVKRLYSGDTQVQLLLKIVSSLLAYLKARKGHAHPYTVDMLNSVFECIENIIEDLGLSDAEKRSMVAGEINKFKEFKAEVLAGGKPHQMRSHAQIDEPAPQEAEPAVSTAKPDVYAATPDVYAAAEEEFPAVAHPTETESAPTQEHQEGYGDGFMELAENLSALRQYVENEFSSMREQIADAGQGPKDLDVAITSLESEFAYLKDRLDQIHEKGFTASPDVVDNILGREFEQMKTRVDDLGQTSGELDRLRSYVEDELKSFQNRIQDLSVSSDHPEDVRADLQSDITAMKGQIDELKRAPVDIADLRSFAEKEFASLRKRLNELQNKAMTRDETRVFLNQEFTGLRSELGNLSGSLADLQELKAFLADTFSGLREQLGDLKAQGAPVEETSASMAGEVAALKEQMRDLSRIPSDLVDLRTLLNESFTEFRIQMNALRSEPETGDSSGDRLGTQVTALTGISTELEGELAQLREDLLATRSDIEAIRTTMATDGTTSPFKPGRADEPSGDPAGDRDTDHETRTMDDSEAGTGGAQEDEPEPREPERTEASMSTEAGDSLTGASDDRPADKRPAMIDSYFTFKLGGQGFAVDERLVVKAGKGDGRIVKKARKTGALTIQDTKRKFFGTRHGLEPAWEDLPTEELKNTRFPVVTSDRPAGLHEGEGGGVLFLANRDRRAVLFTDGVPEKVVLSEEYEVSPSDDQDFVTGAIKKRGEEEGHLILDMAQIM